MESRIRFRSAFSSDEVCREGEERVVRRLGGNALSGHVVPWAGVLQKEKAGSPPPFMSVIYRQYIRGGDNG